MADSLNTTAIHAWFVQRSLRAADETAKIVTARAKEHAPVLKVFAGSTYSTRSVQSRYKGQPLGEPTEPFRLPVRRAINFAGGTGTTSGSVRKEGSAMSEAARRVGHANSEIPVFRFREGGATIRLSGDFRRIDKRTSAALDIAATHQVKGGREVTISPKEARAIASEYGPEQLTSAGRYEFRTKRAAFKEPDSPGAPTTRTTIGGRLKGEIFAQKAVFVGNVVWAYVVSPTVSQDKRSYRYPWAQEFGSAHNRPHPFMRPALHETRGEFVAIVKRNVSAGSQVAE